MCIAKWSDGQTLERPHFGFLAAENANRKVFLILQEVPHAVNVEVMLKKMIEFTCLEFWFDLIRVIKH